MKYDNTAHSYLISKEASYTHTGHKTNIDCCNTLSVSSLIESMTESNWQSYIRSTIIGDPCPASCEIRKEFNILWDLSLSSSASQKLAVYHFIIESLRSKDMTLHSTSTCLRSEPDCIPVHIFTVAKS